MLPEYFEFYNPVKLLCGQWSLENIPYELGRLRVKKPLMLVSGTMLRQGILQMMGEPMPMVLESGIPQDSSFELVERLAAHAREEGCDGSGCHRRRLGAGYSQGGASAAGAGADRFASAVGQRVDEPCAAGDSVYHGAHHLGNRLGVYGGRGGHGRKKRVQAGNCVRPVSARCSGAGPALYRKAAAQTDGCLRDGRFGARDGSLHLPPEKSVVRRLRQHRRRDDWKKPDCCGAAARIRRNIAWRWLAHRQWLGWHFPIRWSVWYTPSGTRWARSARYPHGEAVGLLLPWVMRWQMDCLQPQYAQLLAAFCGTEYYAHIPEKKRGEALVKAIEEMLVHLHQKTGIPARLRDAQVHRQDFSKIAQKALEDGALLVNPKAAGKQDILEILDNAY